MLAYTLTVDMFAVPPPVVSKYEKPTDPLVFGVNCVLKPIKALKLLVRVVFAESSPPFGVVLEYVAFATRLVNPVRRWLKLTPTPVWVLFAAVWKMAGSPDSEPAIVSLFVLNTLNPI